VVLHSRPARRSKSWLLAVENVAVTFHRQEVTRMARGMAMPLVYVKWLRACVYSSLGGRAAHYRGDLG